MCLRFGGIYNVSKWAHVYCDCWYCVIDLAESREGVWFS